MDDLSLIFPLNDTDLDVVTGGALADSIRQNARGGDSVAFGGNGGNATGGLTATGGAGGLATAAAGGAGGSNTIRPAPIPT